MTCRDEILVCAAQVTQRTGQPDFTVQDIIDCMRANGSQYAESTIRTHITSRLCANAPDHHQVTHDDWERTARGTYRLLP
jgi:hypothetical protein